MVTAGAPARVPDTTVFDLRPAGGGDRYRVFVHVPPDPPPARGWPVLYMVDGNAVIATAVDAVRAQASYPAGTNVGPGIVVAVGYPVDAPYDPLRRSWDLSPPPGAAYPPFEEGGPPVRTGGGAAFLGFIEGTLKPWVESRLSIDRRRQALFGHSFGGLFVLYALFARPAAFRTWVSASPAIYWEDAVIARYRDALAPRDWAGLDGTVLLSAGEYEGDALAPFQVGRADAAKRLAHKKETRTVERAQRLAEDIAARTGRRDAARFELFAGETHMSVLPVAVNRAVQAAFALEPAVP